jgi:hypothetical protein
MRPVLAAGTWILLHTPDGVNDGEGMGVLEAIEDGVGIVETVKDEISELDDDCIEMELVED